mgnify:CR=1 FL=1
MWGVSIKEKKYCGTHSKEKEEKGECCQTKEEKEEAQALTYEQSFVTIERHTADNNTKGAKWINYV